MPGLPGGMAGGLHAADHCGVHGARTAHQGGKAHPDGLAGAAPSGLIHNASPRSMRLHGTGRFWRRNAAVSADATAGDTLPGGFGIPAAQGRRQSLPGFSTILWKTKPPFHPAASHQNTRACRPEFTDGRPLRLSERIHLRSGGQLFGGRAGPSLFPDFLKDLYHRLFRGGGEQRHHHDGHQRAEEGRQQLIDGPDAAQRGDQELPDEHHDAADQHAGQGAPFVGALPEQGHQHDRAEGGAEARPGEGDHPEHRAVRVPGQEGGDEGDAHHHSAGHDHAPLAAEITFQKIVAQVLGDRGGGRQQLAVGGGHGGGQDARQDDAGQQGGQRPELADQAGDAHDDGLGVGQVFQHAGAGHGVAHQADDDGHRHGDHHPGGGNPAGEFQLLFLLNGHEADQNVGHAEVSQAPGQQGTDGQQAVGLGTAGGGVVDADQGQVVGQGTGVVQDSLHAARLGHAEAQDHHQGHRHDDGLDQIGEGGGQKSAHDGVDHDDRRRDQHGREVVHAEQGGKQLAAGGKAGGGVGDKEDDDDQRRHRRQQVAAVPSSLGEKLRHGDGVQPVGVPADAPGHNQPVQVGAHNQADGGPAGLGQAGEVGHAGQTHQQPGGHVTGLGAHGGDEGTQLSPSQIEIVHGFVFLGTDPADPQHEQQIDCDGQQDQGLCGRHVQHSFFLHFPTPDGFSTGIIGLLYHIWQGMGMENETFWRKNAFCGTICPGRAGCWPDRAVISGKIRGQPRPAVPPHGPSPVGGENAVSAQNTGKLTTGPACCICVTDRKQKDRGHAAMTWVSETFLKKVNQQKHWPIIIGIVVSGFLLVAMTAVLIWFLVTVYCIPEGFYKSRVKVYLTIVLPLQV